MTNIRPYTAIDLDCLSSQDVAKRWSPDSSLASEDACLAIIDTLFPSQGNHNPAGRGHDCALLTMPGHIALSTDTFFEDTHFRTSYFTPREVGAKALASTVSDLAAAGAIPLGFSLGLMMPPTMGNNALHELLEGMAHVAESHNILLTGGDMAKTQKLGLCITVWGKSVLADGNFFFKRAEALPQDIIFCIGPVGLAKAGLLLFEQKGRAALNDFPLPCQSHLWPKALVDEGTALALLAVHHPNERIGLMDVSDGLAQDIPRLLGGRTKGAFFTAGAELHFSPDKIPLQLREAAKHLKCSAEGLMLSGGEDYALLGTCPPHFWQTLKSSLPAAYAIGEVTTSGSLCYEGTPLTLHGFDHFSL